MKPDPTKLLPCSKHFLYEARMLLGTALAIGNRVGAKLSIEWTGIVEDAILESFTIHFRGLLDFLYGPPYAPKKDDVLATDYSTNWNPGIIPPHLDAERIRVNKEIVHITTVRLKRELNKEWFFWNLAHDVETVFNKFLNEVQPQHLDQTELNLYRQAEKAFRDTRATIPTSQASATSGNATVPVVTMANTPTLPPGFGGTTK